MLDIFGQFQSVTMDHSDLLECLGIGSATQNLLNTTYDASELLTPEKFDTWYNEQEHPLQDGMDNEIDAACSKVLEDIESRQRKKKINIISDIVVKEASHQKNSETDNSKLKQLLKMPKSTTAKRNGFYKMRKNETAEKRKFKFKKPIVPLPAPGWLQKEWAKESSPKKPPQPITPDVIIIDGPLPGSNKENEKPPRKIVSPSPTHPSWIDEFSNSQKDPVAEAFKIRNNLVTKLEVRESDLKKYECELGELNKKIASATEDIARCKKLLKNFNRFSYDK